VAKDRIGMVDGLRGYALLGLFVVHCVERFEVYWLRPAPDAWFDAVFALFSGKAFAIFALLFGFSFATIMGNERARGGDFTVRFAWRLVLLFAIGTLHALIYRGDILQVLAAVGLVLIPFDRVKSDRLLVLLAALTFLELPLLLRAWAASRGLAWGLAQPLFWSDGGLQALATGNFAQALAANAGPGAVNKWSFYVENGRVVEIAGLFLVGMMLQRRRLFAEAADRRGFWLAVLAGGAALWATARLLAPAAGGAAMADTWLQAAFDEYRALGATGFQVAAFVLLWHSPAGRLLAWFAPAGRTTLTLYVGQSLVAAPVLYGYGFGLWDDISNAQAIAGGLVLFAAQAALAAWWLGRYRYGPLEWLWRAGTRTTLAVPFRIHA
jgi:uncharacterized protein